MSHSQLQPCPAQNAGLKFKKATIGNIFPPKAREMCLLQPFPGESLLMKLEGGRPKVIEVNAGQNWYQYEL